MPYLGNPAQQRFSSPRAASVYSGDGSTVAFTLEEVVSTDEDILVSVDGVIQEPSVAYAVSSGTTLTFTAAPSSNAGNNIFVYYIARTFGSVSMPDGQNVNAAVGTFSGTLGVTGVPTFTGRSVHSGGITVANDGQIGSVGDADSIAISSAGVVTFSQVPVGAFISEFDNWRITSNTSNTNSADITANWERNDDAIFEKIGTGLTESSGVFTFPSTGKYLIHMSAQIQARSGQVGQMVLKGNVSTDGTNFTQFAQGEGTALTDDVTSITLSFSIDVTNTTNYKLRFGMSTSENNMRALGASDKNRTYFTAMKLGAT